jgi:predicted secreted hydrolase
MLMAGLILVPTAVSAQSTKTPQTDYDWSFPRDHGSHPNYESEWWYFTGILESDDRAFGYQFTIFRSATGKELARTGSWATNQIFMGHLAWSDPANQRHREHVRVGRGHPELSYGDTSVPGTIRVRDWSLEFEENQWKVSGQGGDDRINLTLKPTKSPLFQGPGGYSAKGPEAGQASQYYSYTRMTTGGTITIDDEPFNVQGTTWFDHEFGNDELPEGVVGWDWISLRLSNGGDLMLYRLRTDTGSTFPFSSATYRDPDGDVQYISSDEWTTEPLAHWTSPRTGARYPIRWRLTMSNPDLELTIRSDFPNQEMVFENGLTAPYWEGMVRAEGRLDGEPLNGRGYIEMTGYVRSMDETL